MRPTTLQPHDTILDLDGAQAAYLGSTHTTIGLCRRWSVRRACGHATDVRTWELRTPPGVFAGNPGSTEHQLRQGARLDSACIRCLMAEAR